MTDTVGLALLRMGGRACAIPCAEIVELVPRVRLSEVPEAPPDLLGVINLRGGLVPVFDVRRRVATSESMPPYQHLVIVRVGDKRYGVAVDEVVDVVEVPPSSIEKFGDEHTKRPGVVRVGDEMVLVLDARMVLNGN